MGKVNGSLTMGMEKILDVMQCEWGKLLDVFQCEQGKLLDVMQWEWEKLLDSQFYRGSYRILTGYKGVYIVNSIGVVIGY